MVPNRVWFVKVLFAHEVDMAFYNKGFKPVIAPHINITILYSIKLKRQTCYLSISNNHSSFILVSKKKG